MKAIDGRTRRCASREGNAVWSILTLGLADEGVDQLVSNLLRWQWPDAGWPAESRHYCLGERKGSGRSLVDWGSTSKRRTNEWVTADALYVLRAARRLG